LTGKQKGQGPQFRQGLGRLRRANAKPTTREGGWERLEDDDVKLDLAGGQERTSHSGESLLARFNRLAKQISATADPASRPGTICGFAGASVLVRDGDHTEWLCVVRQLLKKQVKGLHSPLAVGDHVAFTSGVAGAPGTLGEGVVASVLPRTNLLARADSHNRSLIHVLAANVDHLVVVASLAEPELKPGIIDRYLLIAHHNAIEPAIVLNKADLVAPEVAAAAAALYRGLGYTVFVTSVAGAAVAGELTTLHAHLAGRTAVIAGQSGVGKSSLLNALHPGIAARVGLVSGATAKGRHTTSAARSYRLGEVTLIDTPGIRECGITGLGPIDVALLYRDLAVLQPACHFADCTHRHEPGCAVLAALAAGTLAPSRYASYRSIVDEDLAEQ